MTPSTINSRVLGFLHAELLTNQADIDRIAKYGLILVRSSDFLDQVAIKFGSEAVFTLNEFYRNFLGQFNLVCIEYHQHSYAIRFCNQVEDGGQDGVEMLFTAGKCLLRRLAASFGTTTFTLVKEYKI